MGTFFRRRLAAICGFAVASLSALAIAGPALAKDGQPVDWQIGFQPAATPIMQQIESFHAFVTAIIFGIAIFVTALLAWVMIRYNEKRNPVPSRTSHNTTLEVAWTIVPILILVAIAIPSFRLLFAQYDFPKPDVVVNATGHQWYWSYDYPKQKVSFDSIMVQDADLKPGQPRLLTVDHDMVVPVGKNVLVNVRSTDVIHDWAVPAFGVKLDAVPGRLQKTWFRALRTGTFHGECSELCGRNHAFMPITVKVVTEKQYQAWLAKTQEAEANTTPRQKFAEAKARARAEDKPIPSRAEFADASKAGVSKTTKVAASSTATQDEMAQAHAAFAAASARETAAGPAAKILAHTSILEKTSMRDDAGAESQLASAD